jgi:hypothetical protein
MQRALTFLSLTLLLCPSAAAQCTEDGSCSSPQQVVQLLGVGGTYQFSSDLLVNSSVFGGGPDTIDWHVIQTVGANDTVRVDVSFDSNIGNLALQLLNGCGAVLAESNTNSDLESVIWTNDSGAPVDAVLRLSVPEVISGSTCLDYTVDVLWAGACALQADPFEPNDSCAAATPIVVGHYPNLSVENIHSDWYSIVVPALSTVHGVSTWGNTVGDIDLKLHLDCQSGASAHSVTLNQSAQVTYENTTLLPQTILVEATTTGLGCIGYDFIVSIENGQPGTAYCMPQPNTTGTPGALSSFGSSSLAADNLTLFASSLPPGEVGIFFSGMSVAQIPFFGRTLCVSSPLVRSPIFHTGPTGVILWTYDNFEPMATPGTTRYFQTFYRDPADPLGLNLTNAYRVTFTQ